MKSHSAAQVTWWVKPGYQAMVRRAHAVVDVDAVGLGSGDLVLDAEVREDERRHRRCGAVRAIHEHAQSGHLDFPPLVLGVGVICWVAGFDLIYATQDYEFDRREGLRSLVVKLGIARSLRLAQWLHLAMFAALVAFGFAAKLSAIYFAGMPLVALRMPTCWVALNRSASR